MYRKTQRNYHAINIGPFYLFIYITAGYVVNQVNKCKYSISHAASYLREMKRYLEMRAFVT